MVEKNVQKTKAQSDYLSDIESLEEEVNPYLCTSEEERIYSTIKGSAQATQVVLSHTTVQSNSTVERKTTKTTQNKETFQRAGSRQTYAD